MQNKLITAKLLVFLCLVAAGCGGAVGAGPQAWIDKPLDNSQFERGPIIIQAHASDADGVASFRFFVDGQQINEVSAGGGRLGDASVEWQPPGPGSYTIEVRATDQAGNEGSPAFSTVIIGGEIPAPDALPTATLPEIGATGSPESTSTATLPAPTNTAVPPSATFIPFTATSPLPTPTSPPPTPDTTQPDVTSFQVSPSQILTQGEGCPGSPRTATVTVVATDPSGIATATVFWNVSGDIGNAALGFAGSNTYQGQAGPVNQTGTMSLFVIVEDGAGNQTLTGVMNVTVQSCIL